MKTVEKKEFLLFTIYRERGEHDKLTYYDCCPVINFIFNFEKKQQKLLNERKKL